MSRTYRHRHAPKSAGKARHYVDSQMHQRADAFRSKAYNHIAHEVMRLPCRDKLDRWESGHYWCIPDHLRHNDELLAALMGELIPVKVKGHIREYVFGMDIGSREKKPRRKIVHRRVRRQTKERMRRSDIARKWKDGDERLEDPRRGLENDLWDMY